MSAHAYTEDQLVEQPAIGLFAELGWTTVSALEVTFGATGKLLRETKGEVALVSRLRAALERLKPALPPEAITAAVFELTRPRPFGQPVVSNGTNTGETTGQLHRAGLLSTAGLRKVQPAVR